MNREAESRKGIATRWATSVKGGRDLGFAGMPTVLIQSQCWGLSQAPGHSEKSQSLDMVKVMCVFGAFSDLTDLLVTCMGLT